MESRFAVSRMVGETKKLENLSDGFVPFKDFKEDFRGICCRNYVIIHRKESGATRYQGGLKWDFESTPTQRL